MAYPKPAGYKYAGLTNGTQGYKRFNNAASQAIPYLPGPPKALSKTYQFTAAPADTATLQIQDVGPLTSNVLITRTFTYHYAGAPGTGLIPLVAGGGTAAQAAAATKLALDAQLNNWVITVLSDVITFTSKQPGVNFTITPSTSPAAHMNLLTGVSPTFGLILPARFGKSCAILSG